MPLLALAHPSMLARLSQRFGSWAARFRSTPLGALLAFPIVQAFSRFLGVGAVGLAADATIFSVLDARHMAPEISRAISLGVATCITWRLNRAFTFAASGRRAPVEALRYTAVALLAQGLSYGVFLTLVYGVPALPRLFDLLVGAGLAAFAGFAGHKFFAFAPAEA
ncbi:GtrA family protein [Alsobacter sp. KACC 23698]|uniref:GtrA family protein n=1 Tax=Alsobacter sp. KACC 23698 TaxID=3149229 RepID=A0AAU7JFR4_9HYPH